MTPPGGRGTRAAMIRAILFDKDGTLTDFRATWEAWMVVAVADLARDEGAAPEALARAVGLGADGRFRADAPFVTGTLDQTLARLAGATGLSVARLHRWLAARPGPAPRAAGDPPGTLGRLRAAGYGLGVLTNAHRAEAEADLAALGVAGLLDGLVACDDGHGAKPDPAGALAFAAARGLAPAEVLVVGDGATDRDAAAAAGMPFVAVLTGTAGPEAFPRARAVLADIDALPGWLDAGR